MQQFSQHNLKKKRTSKGTCTLALLFAAVLFMGFLSVLYIVGVSEISQDIAFLTTYLRSGSRTVHKATVELKRPSTSTIEQRLSKKRLAFIITITKDGFFQDGAAVLAYSILKNTQNSDYDISFIAFVHPNVTSSRNGLTKLGYHVVEVPTPVNTSAIRFDFLREKIDKNGCCGAAELIKLNAYRYIITAVFSNLVMLFMRTG